ncbi:hypothetical protein Plhal304r1_c080g0166441 [Plasmopara halstedii]
MRLSTILFITAITIPAPYSYRPTQCRSKELRNRARNQQTLSDTSSFNEFELPRAHFSAIFNFLKKFAAK